MTIRLAELHDGLETEQFIPSGEMADDAQKTLDWKQRHGEEMGADSNEDVFRLARTIVSHQSDQRPLPIRTWMEIAEAHRVGHDEDVHGLSANNSTRPYLDEGHVRCLAMGGQQGYDESRKVMEALNTIGD